MGSSTIVACASGAGPAGVSVIRVSGRQAQSVLVALTGRSIVPRLATLMRLTRADGALLDRALVLWFRAPHSFTGEDVVEFHVHGGRAVVAAVLEACLAVPDVGLAGPGDFTRRAFDNGKLDLSSAEGLGDLIEAETEAQRQQALRQMEGALARRVEMWRELLLDALAQAEGDIDFPDEDLPPGLDAASRAKVLALRVELVRQLQESQAAQIVRDGFRVAIIGAPNAGKSSLLNALARRDAAIVSPIPGTTRDVVDVRLIVQGQVIWLSDTAGLRETSDLVEQEGVKRARVQSQGADLRLAVVTTREELAQLCPLLVEGDVVVLAKADVALWDHVRADEVLVSSHDGTGLSALEGILAKKAQMCAGGLEDALLTRLRHREAVGLAVECLDRALGVRHGSPELVAEDLRLASRALARITGKIDVEDVLDRLFSQFCIGK